MGENFSAEDDVHVEGGFVFAEDERTVGTDALCTVGGEPGVLVAGEAVELSDGAEGRDDLRQRSRFGRSGGDDRSAKQWGAGEVEAGLGGDLGPPFVAWCFD